MSSPQRTPLKTKSLKGEKQEESKKECWYCHGKAIDNDALRLHRFCECSPATAGSAKSMTWAHIHCMAWHIMTTLDQSCTACQSKYKNFRIRRIRRGTREYGWYELLANKLALILYAISIVIAVRNIREKIYAIVEDFPCLRKIPVIRHLRRGPQGNPNRIQQFYYSQKWWTTPLMDVSTLIWMCVNFLFWTHKVWRDLMGDYIVFNNYTNSGQTQDQLAAFHLTETDRMRQRWRRGYEPNLKKWFDKQKNDADVTYRDYLTFDPVPKGFFRRTYYNLRNEWWSERFD